MYHSIDTIVIYPHSIVGKTRREYGVAVPSRAKHRGNTEGPIAKIRRKYGFPHAVLRPMLEGRQHRDRPRRERG